MTSRKLHYDWLLSGVPAKHVGELLGSILTTLNVETIFDISSTMSTGEMVFELFFFFSEIKLLMQF